METLAGTRIGEIVSTIDSLVTELFAVLPMQSVSIGDLVDIQRLLSRAELFCTRTVAAYEADSSCVDEGFRDVAAVMSYHAHIRKNEVTNRLRDARILSMLPQFDRSAESGCVTRTHVGLLSAFVTTQRKPLAIRDEDVLLECAEQFDAAGFLKVLQRWAAHCDDELNDPTDDTQQQEKRSVSLRQLADGTWTLKGILNPEAGQALEAAIENSLPKLVATSSDNGNVGKRDERTLTQRRHDALHDISIEALAADNLPPASGGQRAHISLIVNDDGSAHTMNGYFVSSFTRDMLMCDSVITAIKLNCHGNPFDVGTPQTDIPWRNRRAVIVRDRCCRYPGCDRPARWADIHHIKEREHGGTHEIDNLVLMCRFHHRHIHKHGVQLQWAPDHITLVIKTRNGNLLHAPPHAETHTLMRFPDYNPN